MFFLVLGLLIFLGTHSLRLGADQARDGLISRMGNAGYRTTYALLSATGLGFVMYGFGLARETPVVLWLLPVGLKHLNFLLMFVAMVLLAAAYVPGNAIRSKVRHPMVLSVKVWALAHLLVNGTLAHFLLFGGFLVWSVLVFRASRQRDRALALAYPAGNLKATFLAVGFGGGLWLAMFAWLHGTLIGVRLLA